MIASSRSLARAISTALARPSASSMSTSRAMRLAQAELGLELGEQHVDPPDVAGRAGLRDDEHVERVAGAGDDLDDVAVAPRRVEAVDPHRPHGAAPVELGQGGRPRWPGADSLADGRAGVLEVEEHEVGACLRRLLAHLLAAGRRGQLRSGGAGTVRDMGAPFPVQMMPAARSAARRSASRPSRSPIHGVVVGAEGPAEVVDAPRRLAQPRDRRLHRSSGRGRGRRRHEGAAGPQVLVGEELLGVVDRRGGDLGRLEAPPSPRRGSARATQSPTSSSTSSARAWRRTGST